MQGLWLLGDLYASSGPSVAFWLTLVASVATLLGCTLLSLHVLRHRKPSGSAVAWLGLIWLSPLVGWSFYVLLGVNRVRRKAQRLMSKVPRPTALRDARDTLVPRQLELLRGLARAGAKITGHRLVLGNRFDPLRNGDEAYPAMLEAIERAQRSVALLTYILDDDQTGEAFVDALIRAHERGVAVRVMIDGVNTLRARRARRRLLAAGVPFGNFLWSWWPGQMALVNLRNHRKLLVVDGELAFTGGINLRDAYVHGGGEGSACDLHFAVRGPVVRELMAQFALDWSFDVGEVLEGDDWFPELDDAGPCAARVIPHGPDEDSDKIAQVMFQALAVARDDVLVITPYFLPTDPLAHALAAAAQRGVDVRVVLPATNVPQFMNDVALEDAGWLVEQGVKLGLKQGPFEHTKLMVVDRAWTLLGSSNWDPRSLRLNFELNVEVYDADVAERTLATVEEVLEATTWLSADQVVLRPWPRRLRARLLRLFKPYL
jgi:cardiolipin synthase